MEGMADSKYGIRRAEQKDIRDIYRLSREFARCQEIPEDKIVVSVKDLEANLSSWYQCLVLEHDTPGKETPEVVGYALWTYSFETPLGRVATLNDLYVLPSHRGCGGGRSLTIHLARISAEEGCRVMGWHLHKWDDQALRFSGKLNAINITELCKMDGMDLTEDNFNKLVRGTPKVEMI